MLTLQMQRVNVTDATRYVFIANCNRLWFMFKELNWLRHTTCTIRFYVRLYFTNSTALKKIPHFVFLNVRYLNVFCLENLALFPNLKTSLDLKQNSGIIAPAK
jgi:hypothetical protein